MTFDFMTILAYIAGLILAYFFCRIFLRPIKWLLKPIINGVLGGLLLTAINHIGGFAGMMLVVNPLTALIVGFLGIPGIALIIILQYLL